MLTLLFHFQRGGVLIQKWGRSSAASTAVSIVDGIRSLVTPTPEGDWFSSGVYSTGNPYGIAEDIVFSMPCRSKGDGDYELAKDVIFDDYLRERIKKVCLALYTLDTRMIHRRRPCERLSPIFYRPRLSFLPRRDV
ncbi:hypothetical protein BHM03_00056615 [Ensete ventricosum]|nr:hypothetical protein BHM03_00056615 [Ensete ventricosum]